MAKRNRAKWSAGVRQIVARERRIGYYGQSYVPAENLLDEERELLRAEFGLPRVDDKGGTAWWFDCTDD
jgi:hypothetical protein